MEAKLLTWGGALFLLRYTLGKLQIQRVDVDAEEKNILLRICSVDTDATLPADARLVAAKEVEDTDLATFYPVLVFQALPDAEVATNLSSHAVRKHQKRQRSTTETQAIAGDDEADLTDFQAGRRLFFYILYETEAGDIGLRFLNVVEVPVRNGENGEEDAEVTGDENRLHLQVFLTDGPFVLLFERCSHLVMVLKLQRATQDGTSVGFYLWYENVDLSCGMKDDNSLLIGVVSCTYVSETYSSSPHILIHAQQSQSSSSINGVHHIWSIIHPDIESRDRAAKTVARKCLYLPQFPSIARLDGILSRLEQVTCCCFISELSEWEFEASPSGSFTAWKSDSDTPPVRAELSVSTLFVTGTTNNTVYVYASGILFASFVLPTRPAELWCMKEDSMDQHFLLGVRCEDMNRSFYMLRFSSNEEHRSMELLLSFNHVGHACIGNFVQGQAASVSISPQALLLNDISGITDSNTFAKRNEGGVDEYLDDGQLVKRSVLIAQKTATPEPKLSCHRLRLRDEKKSRDSTSRKRSRNSEKVATSKGDVADINLRTFNYIERTQKASSRDRNTEAITDGAESVVAASHAQLGKLADSLAVRLKNGQQEMKRLEMIVRDKTSLTRQLNQLIKQQWRKQTARFSDENHLFTSLHSIQEVEISPPCQGFIDMETVVDAPPSFSGAAENQIFSSFPYQLRLEQQITLEKFRVVEYVSSSSLIRLEIILKNADTMLRDSYVVLTAPKGEFMSSQGWVSSCSVVSEFPSARNRESVDTGKNHSGKARFHLKVQFAPSFTFLQLRKVLTAKLWLHWSEHRKEPFSVANQSSRTNMFALAIETIEISLENLLNVSNRPPSKNETDFSEDAFGYQEQLLFLSSGSSLTSWFANSKHKILHPVSSIVRSTFALVKLDFRERELMLYEMSQIVATLPSDVYVMYNPFQPQHLRNLQLVLRGMCQTFQQSNVDKDGTQLKLTSSRKQGSNPEQHDPKFLRRAWQQDTDLQILQFIQVLQKRINYHTMWFDAASH